MKSATLYVSSLLVLSENDDQGKTDLEELIRYQSSDTEKAIKRSFLAH